MININQTRKGYISLVGNDGSVISQHVDDAEAYTAAAHYAANNIGKKVNVIAPNREFLAEQKNEYIIYDALLYQNKPKLNLLPITVVYQNQKDNKGKIRSIFVQEDVKFTAENLPDNRITCLDIELPVHQLSVVEKNIDKLIEIMSWFRAERPDLKFGFYGETCVFNWKAIYGEFDEVNSRVLRLGPHIDYVFPSLYSQTANQNWWRRIAGGVLAMSNVYDKPIVPFLWPQYSDSSASDIAGSYIPANDFIDMIKVCNRLADGCVLWGGYKQTWNNNAEWWLKVKNLTSNI